MSRKWSVVAIVFLLVVAFLPAIAQSQSKEMIFTVTNAVAVPNAVLAPGEYHLRFIDSNYSVAVLTNPDGEVIGTYLVGHGTQRVEPADVAKVILGRLGNGSTAIHEWFYPGDYVAHEFMYEFEQPVTVE